MVAPKIPIQSVVTYDAPTVVRMTRFAMTNGQIKIIKGGLWPRHRKQIVITNEDNSNKMAIVQAASEDSSAQALKGLTIFTNSSVGLFTNSDIAIKASDGAISEVQVLEIVYQG